MLLGFASVNELQDIYGEKPVKSIMSMLGTKLVFRTSEPDAAEWNSKMLLEEDVMAEQQGISFGTNDNLNASDRRERQALVTASEIATIPDLTAFVRFAGDWPTSKTAFTYKAWPDVAVPFIPRSLPEMMRHSDELAEDTAAIPDKSSPLDGMEPLI
jgi:type IV secretory pathway TraG/TraD family ATPase VirD4